MHQLRTSIFNYINPRNIFTLLGFLFIAQQVFVLFSFSLNQSDTDQMLMWEAAKDMSQGHFYTPYFYGQQYNSMAEAVLATPLILLGLKVYYAVPLATWVMSLFPWIIIFLYCKKHTLYSGGILILLLLFSLSQQYAILTHMSRGFVQAIFFTFIGLGFWWFGSKKPIHFFLLLFLTLLGSLQVPNNVLLYPSIVLLFWDKLWLRRWYLIYGTIAFFMVGVIYFGVENIYLHHPEYVVHPKPLIKANISQFLSNIKSIHLLFIHIFKGQESAHLACIFCGVLIGIITKKYWQMLIFLFIVLLSISINKVADVTESVFFSGGRFYMAIPLVFALFLLKKFSLKPKVLLAIAFVGIGLSFIQTAGFSKDITTKPWRGKEAPVLSFTLDEINCACDSIQKITEASEALIIYDHYFVEAVSLGCPILKKEFPLSSRYRYERRSWLKSKMDCMIPKRYTVMDRFSSPDSVRTLFPTIELQWIEGQAYRIENKRALRLDSIMRLWNQVPR